MEERLQKILAHAGIASRRKAEEFIAAGRVELNGKIVRELGTKADLTKDVVRVDGSVVSEAQEKVWFVLYKPAGCVTTLSDPEGRATIKRYLSEVLERVYPVGRLDYDVEGALLVTNDGDLAHLVMHPRFGVRRTYLAKVQGTPEPALIQKLLDGVRLSDGRAKALEAELHSRTPRNSWVRVVVAEGRPHLVKRLMEAAGMPVQKLYRADYGGIGVEGLRPGELRPLSKAEIEHLRSQAGKKATPTTPGRRAQVPLPARRHGHGPPQPKGREKKSRRPSARVQGRPRGAASRLPRGGGAKPTGRGRR